MFLCLGLKGVLLSVMIASLLASLTSIFNSASTIFTIDVWAKLRKKPSEVEQVLVGRIFVVILGIVSIAWIPVIELSSESELYHYINNVTSLFSPSVTAVYLLAILWERINEHGAFWGLIVGLITGLARFCMEIYYTYIIGIPLCGSNEPDPRPWILTKVHYLHFGLIVFGVTSIVTIAVSLMTKPIDKKHVCIILIINHILI